MENRSRVLNLLSLGILILLGLSTALIVNDTSLSWKLFPGDSALFLPLLFLVPLMLSMKNRDSRLAKIIVGISILGLTTTGILSLYVLLLGSAWSN